MSAATTARMCGSGRASLNASPAHNLAAAARMSVGSRMAAADPDASETAGDGAGDVCRRAVADHPGAVEEAAAQARRLVEDVGVGLGCTKSTTTSMSSSSAGTVAAPQTAASSSTACSSRRS